VLAGIAVGVVGRLPPGAHIWSYDFLQQGCPSEVGDPDNLSLADLIVRCVNIDVERRLATELVAHASSRELDHCRLSDCWCIRQQCLDTMGIRAPWYKRSAPQTADSSYGRAQPIATSSAAFLSAMTVAVQR